MEGAGLLGRTGVCMRGSFRRTTCIRKALINEQMDGSIQGSEGGIKWKAKECLHDWMDEFIQGSTGMTRKRGMECSHGAMDGGMKGIDSTGSSMERGYLHQAVE